MTEDLPPDQLPKDYIDEVVREYYDANLKVTIKSEKDENIGMSSGEMPMDIDKPKVENTAPGVQVSGTNFVQSWETLNPHSMKV